MNEQIEEIKQEVKIALTRDCSKARCLTCEYISEENCEPAIIAEHLYNAGYRKIPTNDWLTKGISEEQLEREKQEALDEFAKENGYRKASMGNWVDVYNGKYANQLYRCSVCGNPAYGDGKIWFLTKFCPSCGADMRGEVQ